ncbi:hypothetical protein C0991_000502, partial [Blastosporella zonata]
MAVTAAAAASQTPDPDRTIRIAQAVNYPNRAWFCIAAFIALVSIVNVLCHIDQALSNRRQKPPTTNNHRGRITLSRLPSATANAFRAIVFRSTFQIGSSCSVNVAELFLTAAYATLVLVWSLVHTTNTLGMKYDPKYWANIASSVATTQLPLVAALGSKNNIIAFLTGVSYEKLNYLHRMAARVLCVLIWVHASGRIKIGLVGTLSERIPWVHCGVLAITAFTILGIVSVQPLRSRNYEMFLVGHMLLVFITLMGAYFHTRGVTKGEQDHIWPTFIVWGLDRAIRVIRIIVYNTGYFKKGSSEQVAQFEVRAPNFVRVTLRRPTYLRWRPGQSAYLRIPGALSTLFESHPFTIASIDVSCKVSDTEKSDEIAKEEEGGSGSGVKELNVHDDLKTLSFLIGVRSGFTQRLLRAISVEEKQEMKVIFEGPYGSPPRLGGFGTVVLIAGGSGVSLTIPLLLDVVRRAKQGARGCTKVVFIWAIRDADCLNWVIDAIRPAIENLPSHLTVEIRVYVTTARINSTESSDEETMTEACNINGNYLDVLKFPGVDVIGGRPALEQLVKDVISQDQSGGAIAFT